MKQQEPAGKSESTSSLLPKCPSLTGLNWIPTGPSSGHLVLVEPQAQLLVRAGLHLTGIDVLHFGLNKKRRNVCESATQAKCLKLYNNKCCK